MKVGATRIYNEQFIKVFMAHPEIFACVTEDGAHSDEFTPDVENEFWLLVSNDEAVIGLYRLHPTSTCALTCHANILPEFRREYSDAAAEAVYEWILDECPPCFAKFNSQVPENCGNVAQYLERHGWAPEGYSRKSWRKGGQLLDLLHYGITRDEIRGRRACQL